ncbi:MAG: glycosyltransferase family protein [Candidatus Peribacteraceae bacterium]
MPSIIATILVRMGSERLPGKHMRIASGKPLLGHMLERVQRAEKLGGIIVATPESTENDVIEELCQSYKIPCFRGSEDDVLGRMLGALEDQNADIGVQIYGDGYLIDPAIIDHCIETYLKEQSYDLVGNDLKHTFPSGQFVEAFSVSALRNSANRTQDPAVREHGTLFVRQHPDLYALNNIEAQDPLRRPDIHLDVDTQEDAEVIESILNHFAPRNDFTLAEIIAFLDANPKIAQHNQHVQKRWKQYQSS